MPKNQPISRRAFLASAAGNSIWAQASTARSKPNVLFILTDDQRQDTIHALGNQFIQTPNLDRLFRSGMHFPNAYCMGGFVAAVCLPSRMMIHRGRSWFSVRKLPPGYPNFARSMSEAGYVTYHLGKRGNEDLESHKSFDHNFYVEPNDVGERDAAKPGKQVAERSIEFLDGWKKNRAKPFFMCLSGPAPHDPRLAPPEYLARYDESKLPLPRNFLPFHPFDNGELLVRDEQLAPWPRTPEEIRKHLRDYYAVIAYMDEQIGRIFEKLREIGEFQNTIIVFTSDQGIAIGSHGLMGKQNLYEPSMRAGIVFAGPGIPANKKSSAFAYLFDIYPTICELTGAQIPNSLEGKSLAPVIQGRRKRTWDTIFLGYRDFQRAVRKGRWKLIRYPNVNRTQLFDLDRDPDETRDLSASPNHAARVKELLTLLAAQQKVFGDTLPLSVPDPGPASIGLSFFKPKIP